jgi:DNA (cytosine-5)-methyltransferase 1
MSKVSEKKLTYISLFSSAGIGCYGFKKNKFNCVATNEIIDRRLEIQKYNKKCKYETGYISGDVTSRYVKKKIFNEISFWKNKEHIKDIDVLIATPPCQGMSVANHKKKDEKDRNSLVIESIKLVKEINPKFFIFENVRAFLNTTCTDIDGTDKSIKEAIMFNLGGTYNILSEIVNFKEYGVPSSRNRTLVIGVRKDITDITPYDIFPDEKKEIVLKKSIGSLPRLKEMGEFCKDDIYHNFRRYDPRMVDWIKDLREGESAFNNKDKKKIPHRIINGKIVYNANKNGDKYSRCYWNKVGPCIHTRNDILASQATIHPEDNRVFSIRELMVMMSIPNTFKWTNIPLKQLNKLSLNEKRNFLKKNEMNIRQSIGEAVPTKIFDQIAFKIKAISEKKLMKNKDIQKIIEDNKLYSFDNLLNFIKKNNSLTFTELSKIAELSNSKRTKNAAYYTSQDICFSIIKDLPALEMKKNLRILEPSVGCGNFLPLIFKKYLKKESIIIDLFDIDENSLTLLRTLLEKIRIPSNFKLNFHNEDFLTYKFDNKYDLVIGNPPFKKITKNKILLKEYKENMSNKRTNNLFSFFIEKSIKLGGIVALITPKSLISTPELNKTRNLIEEKNIFKIIDYGEKAFQVKIETISFIISDSEKTQEILIESYITNEIFESKSSYIMDSKYPYWLLYRNHKFDNISKKLIFNVFESFRDRQITKKITNKKGKFRILKSRNLDKNGEIINIKGYDTYINNIDGLAVSKFLNDNKVIIVPNLSYCPRAGYLPKDSIVDGSLAVLTPKKNIKITEEQLDFFSTEEFTYFYRIARNRGTRSLNIDNNSVFFWGAYCGN